MRDIITYREIEITYNFYGKKEFTIQYCGDDYVFNTFEEAKDFIDNEICVLPFC